MIGPVNCYYGYLLMELDCYFRGWGLGLEGVRMGVIACREGHNLWNGDTFIIIYHFAACFVKIGSHLKRLQGIRKYLHFYFKGKVYDEKCFD